MCLFINKIKYMKNKLLLLIVISLMILPSLSFAETNKETIKSEIDAKKESIKNSVEERRQNAVNKIKERINKFVENVVARYEAATNRLETLADRIESRITKIESRNIDVIEAKELLTVARSKIETAKISVANIASTTSISSLASTTGAIKKEFEDIKTQMERAKEDIKIAHAALVNVVENLKPGDNKMRNSTTATSTATTTKIED